MLTRRDSIYLMGASAMGLLTGPQLFAATSSPLAGPLDWSENDPRFAEPFIDTDEWRDRPVRHRYVHGGFKGNDALFSLYFPTKEQYHGRFFQPINATPGNENTATGPSPISLITQENSTIGFAFDSGGYLVESNLGSKTIYPSAKSVSGLATSAAVAQLSRKMAAEMYGAHRPYGYIYGGSGGSQKTIGYVENTNKVWDGAVPYVTGSTMSMPNVFTVQAHALRILKDKLPQIIDATDPGGSGDIYAGLNEEEKGALLEATRLGLPPKAWFDHERLGYGPLSTLIDTIGQLDPTYYNDFWKVPGYLGASPPESLKRARVQQKSRVTKIIMSDEARTMGLLLPMAASGATVTPAAFQLENMPKADLKGATLFMTSGGAAGKNLSITGVTGELATLGIGAEGLGAVNSIKVGDELTIDNSIYLAAQTYHRHQVPSREYKVWDQFRKPDGTPLYPQRPILLGPIYQEMGCGTPIETGKTSAKLIVLETLVDEYAYPWQADWYRSRVKSVHGNRLDDHFRLYFIDNAMHTRPFKKSNYRRIVSYVGALQQTLRDLAAWVEKGVPPPANSSYKVEDGQVYVPKLAQDRKGFQPVVKLTVKEGGVRTDAKVGELVTLAGTVDLPRGTGKIVAAAWDFEGNGDYPVIGALKFLDTAGERATVTTTYKFTKPGTYFPSLMATSQREGNANSGYGRIDNLDRVRVVVS